MNILVAGSADSLAEFKLKFGSKHSITGKSCSELVPEDIIACDIVFDFEITSEHSHGSLYALNPDAVILVNSVKTTLKELCGQFGWQQHVIGFNGLPGMFNRPLLELAVDHTGEAVVQELCDQLGTGFRLVHDRIGMVTPRVVCMIINEAFYTVQEGTANQHDIDLAMKLGTNYPAGPFEMLGSIGVKNVYQILDALYQATGESRYRVCPLLKEQYLQQT